MVETKVPTTIHHNSHNLNNYTNNLFKVNTTKRIPRPMGLTILSLQAQKDQTSPQKQELLKKHLIKHWLNNSLTINQQHINQQTLMERYDITKELIQECTVEALSNTFTNTDDLDGLIREGLKMTLAWTLEDRGLIAEHIYKIKLSEGGHYKPFITSELTKAMKLGTESTQNLMKLMQAIMPSGPSTSLTQIFMGTQQQVEGTMTTNRALQLMAEMDESGPKSIEQTGPNHYLPAAYSEGTIEADELHTKHNISDYPEVGGRALDTENAPRMKDLREPIAVEQEGPKTRAEHRERHDNHRADELGLE